MYSDVIEGQDNRISDLMGVREEDLPTMRIIVSTEDILKQKFEYAYNFDDFSVEDVAGFIENVDSGKIK